MSDEPVDPVGPAGSLEPVESAEAAEQPESPPDEPRKPGNRLAALGYRSRLERRTSRLAARRRKARVKLWYMAGPALVVIAAIVVLLILFGGAGDDGSSGTTTTTAFVGPKAGSCLLIIEQDDAVPVMVLVHPRSGDGVVLGVPGMTLLRTPVGFKILAEMYTPGQDKALVTALTEAFGVGVGPVASVQWTELRSAMLQAGVLGLPAAVLGTRGEDAEGVARAVMGFLRVADSEKGSEAWAELALEGDPSGFRAAADSAAASLSGGEWTAVGLAGRLVEGADSSYFEGEVAQARALLTGAPEVSTITVEVQNGSGVIGVAEEAVARLKPLGYTMLPVSNSPDFPDVIETRITVSPDAALPTEQVRALLGVGTVTEDDSLDPGEMLIVLGKDFAPPTVITTVPTG